MFNSSARASISEFHAFFDRVVRDGAFHSVGKIPTRLANKLVPLTSEKYLGELLGELATIAGVVCTEALVPLIPEALPCAVSERPLEAVFKVHEQLCERSDFYWSSFESRIAPTAKIHPTAYISETDVIIGEHTVVGPKAVIMPRVIMGADCFVGAGTVIGSEAYEMMTVDGCERLYSQIGGVNIGSRVVFLTNVAVARSVFPVFTIIEDEASFDNLTHVAHDCIVRRGAEMTACSMLAGRVELGPGAYLGPNATVSNGVTLGEGATLTIGSTAVRDIPAGSRMTGVFAIEHKTFLRNLKRQAAQDT